MSLYKMVELGTLIQQAKTVRCGSDDYPVLSMTMHDGLVFQDDKFKKIIASKDRSDYKVVKRNQLVISFPIDEGVLAAQRIVDAGIVSPAYGIWDIDQEKILPEFLEYALRCDRALSYYKAKLRGSTARRRSLPTPTLLAFTVPLPGVSEQQFVLDVIHKAKKIIDNRSEEIQQLDNLVKARFVEIFGDQKTNPFGWEQCTIGKCCTLKSGTSLPSEVENEGGPIPYIKVGDMNYPGNERYITTSSRYVSEATAGKGLFEVGSILFPKRGGAIGTNKKRMTTLPVCADLNVMGVASKGRLRPEYLMAYFDMIDLGALSDGSSVPQINNKNIAPLVICIPPLELQEQFAAFVKQTNKSKVVVQKALDEAQTLFDSLMQEYFG